MLKMLLFVVLWEFMPTSSVLSYHFPVFCLSIQVDLTKVEVICSTTQDAWKIHFFYLGDALLVS